MAFYPATLEPMPSATFKPCGFSGCLMLATHFLKAGGQRQFCCCSICGAVAIEADRAKPGVGWKGR